MLKLFNRKKKDNKGFTLVELVVVVAILGILVGLLAPQYTKYVEQSRKAADASNMDEMVKVLQVFAADPANAHDFQVGKYQITIDPKKDVSIKQTEAKGTAAGELKDDGPIKTAMTDAIPDWKKTKTKSRKWGEGGTEAAIFAEIEVKEDGGTIVKYGVGDGNAGDGKFAEYMQNGTTSSSTTK